MGTSSKYTYIYIYIVDFQENIDYQRVFRWFHVYLTLQPCYSVFLESELEGPKFDRCWFVASFFVERFGVFFCLLPWTCFATVEQKKSVWDAAPTPAGTHYQWTCTPPLHCGSAKLCVCVVQGTLTTISARINPSISNLAHPKRGKFSDIKKQKRLNQGWSRICFFSLWNLAAGSWKVLFRHKTCESRWSKPPVPASEEQKVNQAFANPENRSTRARWGATGPKMSCEAHKKWVKLAALSVETQLLQHWIPSFQVYLEDHLTIFDGKTTRDSEWARGIITDSSS